MSSLSESALRRTSSYARVASGLVAIPPETVAWLAVAVEIRRSVVAILACILASKKIQLIYGMQHDITVYGVVFGVAPAHCVYRAAERTLVVQHVVELQHDRQRLAFQERMAHLRIPHQLVGVQRIVVVSPARVHVQVGSKACAPRRVYIEIETV